MGATEPVEERQNDGGEDRVEDEKKEEEEVKDVEKGEVDSKPAVVGVDNHGDFHVSNLRTLNLSNPLRIVVNAPPPSAQPVRSNRPPRPPRLSRPAQPVQPVQPAQPAPPAPRSQPRSTPTPQPSIPTLNSRVYTNKISLFLFLLHMVVAVGLVCFLIFKGVQGLIEASASVKKAEKRVLVHYLPQVEAASLLSITLAFTWQKAVRQWPKIMIHFILWSSFLMSLSAGILLICFQKPATNGLGVCFIAFAIGNGLYACWVTQRIRFCCDVLEKSLEPVSKFPDLNQPIYWMLGAGFLWMSLWILAVVGALNFSLTPLIIILLALSLAWTAEVMRNIANLTVSRAIALYYLRGMQSSTQFCFQRALTINLGSACLGSLFVPTIEALRIVARGLNLLEGEDEFMFSCAHCCLRVMQSIFKFGNGWAFVQIAAYGKNFVRASIDTWALFESREMESIVDSDITSSVCFLTGVCSGSICVIVVAAWTSRIDPGFIATISLLALFIGYLMTRIAMAVPHACVSCYYVCYAENPQNRLFDTLIKDRLNMVKSGRDVVVPTPRVPHRFREA